MVNTAERPNSIGLTIRDARPSDAPFLAKCIMAGMHFYDFATPHPEDTEIYNSLVDCERGTDLLYSHVRTRVAEVDGVAVGSLLSYPGDIYRDMLVKTFRKIWPGFFQRKEPSDQEADPGEYYLDSLAVVPEYRGRGIGRALMRDGIQKGISLGYDRITLVVDSDMPELAALYETVGFRPAEHRRAFGVDFLRMVYIVRR